MCIGKLRNVFEQRKQHTFIFVRLRLHAKYSRYNMFCLFGTIQLNLATVKSGMLARRLTLYFYGLSRYSIIGCWEENQNSWYDFYNIWRSEYIINSPIFCKSAKIQNHINQSATMQILMHQSNRVPAYVIWRLNNVREPLQYNIFNYDQDASDRRRDLTFLFDFYDQ